MPSRLTQSPLKWPIVASNAKPTGDLIEFEASKEDCVRLEGALDILNVKTFQFALKVSRFRKTGLKVKGVLKSVLEQSCVVSLEAVEESIDIEIDRSFLPLKDLKRENERMEAGELLLNVDDEHEIDELEGGTVDLWDILIEEISLELDPFPRHADYQHDSMDENVEEDVDIEKTQPFSSLKALINEKKSKK